MNPESARQFVDARWDESVVSELVEYIRIPNKSPNASDEPCLTATDRSGSEGSELLSVELQRPCHMRS